MISRQSFNNVLDFQNKFNKFVSDFKGEQTPQQRVQELLDSGKMTQEQYNTLKEMANKRLKSLLLKHKLQLSIIMLT